MKLQNESHDRLQASVRKALIAYAEVQVSKKDLKKKIYLISERKFCELMMSLGSEADKEREKENYRYFCRRFFLRMRKDKLKPITEPVPTEDLVDFLKNSKGFFQRLSDSDIESAVNAYTNGRDSFTLDEFTLFATGHVIDNKK